jgi:hypothetical protein
MSFLFLPAYFFGSCWVFCLLPADACRYLTSFCFCIIFSHFLFIPLSSVGFDFVFCLFVFEKDILLTFFYFSWFLMFFVWLHYLCWIFYSILPIFSTISFFLFGTVLYHVCIWFAVFLFISVHLRVQFLLS